MNAAPPPDLRTAYLGRYNEFEVEIVLELLQDAGIFAFAKHQGTEPDHFTYSKLMESERGVVIVDASRVDEARKLLAEELPKHLKSIQEAMDQLELPPD
jgi:transcription initiation factor IIE alpha subunit